MEKTKKQNETAQLGIGAVSGCSSPKIILHLCADLGSDSLFYQLSDEYEVIMIGEEIGVENYHPPKNVHGIIANPVCTEFSTAKCFTHVGDIEKGMFLVNHCLRIIKEAQIEAYNEAIDNAAKNAITSKKIYHIEIDQDEWDLDSLWCNKHSILKLKK